MWIRTRVALTATYLAILLTGLPAGGDTPDRPPGYFEAGSAPDPLLLVAVAPEGAVAEADRYVFRETRKLQGSARWALAMADDDEGAAIAHDFSCALGVVPDANAVPVLTRLLSRTTIDLITSVEIAKQHYKRKRPYLVDKGDICVTRSPALAASYDYPSGHAAYGFAIGLILAEASPDRAGPILARARAFGESRAICGVHNLSSVHAGWTQAAEIVAALHGSVAFRRDMEAARAEVAALRRVGVHPTDKACAEEAVVLSGPGL